MAVDARFLRPKCKYNRCDNPVTDRCERVGCENEIQYCNTHAVAMRADLCSTCEGRTICYADNCNNLAVRCTGESQECEQNSLACEEHTDGSKTLCDACFKAVKWCNSCEEDFYPTEAQPCFSGEVTIGDKREKIVICFSCHTGSLG